MADEPIVSTKDRPGSYDAIETAKPGEPLFPIQGGDPFGPPTVLHWVKLCREEGLRLLDSRHKRQQERGKYLLRKATDAELVAWSMVEYQRDERAERPSAAEEVEQIAQTVEIAKEREGLIRASALLHNHLSGLIEVADLLDALDTRGADSRQLRLLAEQAVVIADRLEPRRGQERS